MIIIGLIRIYATHPMYTKRLNVYRNFLKATENSTQKKLIIPASVAPMNTLLMTWASSYEFWLLSTIEKGESRSVIIEEKPGEFDWAMPERNSFIAKWGLWKYDQLDKRYFIFQDSTQYRKY